MTQCKRCLLSDDIPGVHLHRDGECNFCRLHDDLNRIYPVSPDRERIMIQRIKRRGRRRRYDCLIGISGGVDSSWLLHWAAGNGLRALAFHFDNGFNSDFAERNMKRMLEATGFPCLRFSTDHRELRRLNKAFLMASVSDVDIPNDIAMGKLMMTWAIKLRIPTIINGHSFRQEGSVPLGWTYMDGRYVSDVYRQIMGVELKQFPNLGLLDQVRASLRGIHTETPYYHMDHSKVRNMEFLKERYGWEPYQGRHTENEYTAFAGWHIYMAYGIDKRRIELSAWIRSGDITRKQAVETMQQPCEPVGFDQAKILEALQMKEKDYARLINQPRKYFWEYQTYHRTFRRWRLAFWLLVKLGFLRQTFYRKYTRKIQTDTK